MERSEARSGTVGGGGGGVAGVVAVAETIAFAARLVCLSLALAALSRFAFMASGQQVGQRVNWAPFLSNL